MDFGQYTPEQAGAIFKAASKGGDTCVRCGRVMKGNARLYFGICGKCLDAQQRNLNMK